jgi:SAM-dependent methyltransferase
VSPGPQPSAAAATGGEIFDVRLAQAGARDWAQSAGGVWSDAESLWRHMSENTNQPRAAMQVDWNAVCPRGATVLDLGCGAGWLTAMLSRRVEVARIIAWDSSPALLANLLPQMLSLLEGEADKVEPICGGFIPLILDDHSVDLIVMASAFHHCSEPLPLLAEMRRVLRPGASVLLLNETPWRVGGMLWFDLRLAASHLVRLVTGRGPHWPGSVADNHVLYDPALGDRAYTMGNWHSLMREAGWHLHPIATGLSSYPESFRSPSRFEPELTHFLLRPA